jgi:RNA polymerase sigma factor (sigma-70 family)
MENSQATDQVLECYLSAQGPSESEELGELLAARASPTIRKVVFSRISDSRADAEDVCAEAILHLVQRLQRYKEEEGRHPIEDFRNYAAATAHHACDQYLRRKNPALWRLRNRIRYLLEHDAKLAMWRNSQGVALCGLAMWKDQEWQVKATLAENFVGTKVLALRELIFQLFRSSGGPVELNDAVEVARTLLGVPSFVGEDGDAVELAETRETIDQQLEQRTYAAELWKEIQDLPARQRYALLFNLRNDAMNLLLLTGVASFREVAMALEMQPEDLASLWNGLPFEDTDIARRLGCTRQQVINLRMAARKRLANRLAGWR